MKLDSQFPVPKPVYEWLKSEKLRHLDSKHYVFMVRAIAASFYSLRMGDKDFPFLERKCYSGINIRTLGNVSTYDKPSADNSDKHNNTFVSQFGHNNPLIHFYHYEARVRVRKFVLETWFGIEFIPLYKKEMIENDTPVFVNLYDGRTVDKKAYFSKKCYYPPANRPSIRQSLKCIQSRPFNKQAIIQHLRTQEERGESFARQVSDIYAWVNILLMGIDPVDPDNGIYSYKPKYRISSSGRVAEIGGGLQSCTRNMKFSSIQGIADIHNYDLKGSQVNGLIHQFKLQDLDTSWLEKYVNNPNAKNEYAERVGLSVECWKQCLLLVIMGGSTNTKKPADDSFDKFIHTDFYREIKVDLTNSGLEPSVQEVYDKRLAVLHELDGLLKPLRKWRSSLKNNYYKLGSHYGRVYQHRIQLKNYLGIPYYTDEFRQAELAARVLQGQEAAFIHLITQRSCNSTFKVVANEHDGVITLGKIPDEVINSVKGELGIEEYELVEKSIL